MLFYARVSISRNQRFIRARLISLESEVCVSRKSSVTLSQTSSPEEVSSRTSTFFFRLRKRRWRISAGERIPRHRRRLLGPSAYDGPGSDDATDTRRLLSLRVFERLGICFRERKKHTSTSSRVFHREQMTQNIIQTRTRPCTESAKYARK